MRPRRARLGCDGGGGRGGCPARGASMRPRRARLGCVELLASPARTYTCFNEAEARAPRMRKRNPTISQFQPVASMRPRRARLGCSHPTSPWIPRQSCRVFDWWPTAMGETCQILHAIVLTMSKSFTIPTIYRDSSGYGVPRSTSSLESTQRVRNTFNQGRPSLFPNRGRSY